MGVDLVLYAHLIAPADGKRVGRGVRPVPEIKHRERRRPGDRLPAPRVRRKGGVKAAWAQERHIEGVAAVPPQVAVPGVSDESESRGVCVCVRVRVCACVHMREKERERMSIWASDGTDAWAGGSAFPRACTQGRGAHLSLARM